MKRWIIGAFVLVLAGGAYVFTQSGEDRRIERAIGIYDCPPPPEAMTFGARSYDGPLIDGHLHIAHPPEGPEILDAVPSPSTHPQLGKTYSASEYVCVLDTDGITKAFIFFPVFPGLEDLHLKVVHEVMKKYPDRFVPFIMPPDQDDRPDGFPTVDAATLKEWLGVYPDLFDGYGEIGLYERDDHGGPAGSPALPPDSVRLREIYPVVRENNLLVYFHLGEGQQAAFERALSANPDIDFVFHGDQLIPTENGKQDLSAIETILYRHPNAYYEVDELWGDVWIVHPERTKEQFFAHFENYEELLEKDVATWKGFIERHPNQVLWGSDRGVANLWSMDRDVGLTLTRYVRAFIARLDPSVQDKYAYKNAERLIRKHTATQ